MTAVMTLTAHTEPMQQIHSSIDIDAPDHLVWAILTDFGSYELWNPYIRTILGKPSTGNMLRIALRGQCRAITSMGSLLTRARETCELRWRKRTVAPGLYTAEHSFRIETLSSGGVRFHQIEQIKGLFAPFLSRGSQRAMEEGFHAMNHALKARAERMHEGLVTAAEAASSSGINRRIASDAPTPGTYPSPRHESQAGLEEKTTAQGES